MADNKPTTAYYQNLGGINQKASKYEMSTAQFLDIRNLDFDVPKALQKRPGSTFGIGSSNGTSGPIQTLFEFVKLTGESYIVAASDTALFYASAGAYALLNSGWNNGQPPDMLTFLNKMWVANGDKYSWWDGTTLLPTSLPSTVYSSVGGSTFAIFHNSVDFPGAVNASFTSINEFTVAGATMRPRNSDASFIVRGIYVAYSFLRSDGYQGPANFLQDARNVVDNPRMVRTNGGEWFNFAGQSGLAGGLIGGFTVPAGRGISAINIWVATDTVDINSARSSSVVVTGVPGQWGKAGALGYAAGFDNTGNLDNETYMCMSYTLLPTADLSRFKLFTTIPGANLAAIPSVAGITTWNATFYFGSDATFAQFNSVATSGGFSGMPYALFTTYVPKYLELNQNIMFYSGFSTAPSRVDFSEIGQPETVLPDSFFEVRTNDGDRVMGMHSYNNYLLILKERSFHKLIGDSADNFQLIQLSTDYGCLSDRAFVTVDQTAFWLDKKGIIQFTGANWSVLSGPIENIFRRMNVSVAKEKATSVHHIYRNQIWFGIPVDGSTVNNLTIVYDYLVQAWTFFDGFNAASFAYIKGALDRPTAWRGDYSGMIHYTGESFMQDSNQGISCLALTHFENEGGENQTTIWRRFFLDVATVTGASSPIKGQVFSNYNTTTVQSTFQMFQGQFQTRAEMGVVGKSVAAQVAQFSTNTPLLINGYSWAKRGLRNV